MLLTIRCQCSSGVIWILVILHNRFRLSCIGRTRAVASHATPDLWTGFRLCLLKKIVEQNRWRSQQLHLNKLPLRLIAAGEEFAVGAVVAPTERLGSNERPLKLESRSESRWYPD